MNQSQITDFQTIIMDYYCDYGRHDLPWRQPDSSGFDPYKIMVSEVMLQQTQVGRVIPKYEAFLNRFPDAQTLAVAPLKAVLEQWIGLGYNRRAQYLQRAVGIIQSDYDGKFPKTAPELIQLPGVGVNTAGAILAYAYNQPTVFIETNIRSVFIHHFFVNKTDIHDMEIAALVKLTLDQQHPREWYWALMDYGTHLKQTAGNASARGKNYTRQSAFEGSVRQIRGQVLKSLQSGPMSLAALRVVISDARLPTVIDTLCAEKLITFQKNRYQL